MKANDLGAPAGETFKFDTIGDTLEGTITYVGDWQEQINKFNDRTEQVARIGVANNGDASVYIWPRKGSAMAQAIADALRDAKLDELTEGQTLKLRYDSEKDTGKGNPMKVFRAKITQGEAPRKPAEEPF